jgi:hypothetical protein
VRGFSVFELNGGKSAMHAKSLDFVIYESQWKWRDEQLPMPTWPQIEEAIRRLDKFHYPFLSLWPMLDQSLHELTDEREWFNIIGGKGEYWFAATIGGQWENRFMNAAGSNLQVELWTSDQGFAAPEKEVCRDIDLVLRAARFYAEYGGYDPSISWKDRPVQ